MSKDSGFTFRQTSDPESSVEVWEVSHSEDRKKKQVLGTVKTYPNIGHGWCIDGFDGHWATKINVAAYASRFQTKEDAAWAMFVIKQTCEANPLSTPVREYIDTRASYLREERNQVQGRFFDIQREQRCLQKIAEANGLDKSLYDFGADTKKEVNKLLEFMREHNQSLCELQGKDFVRSLRARLSSVIKLIDPEAALEI